MKILLTGSTGFIGRNIKEQWADKYDIFAPNRLELDLRYTEKVKEYLKFHKFDVVIHAANTNDFTNKLSLYEILDYNLRMFYNLEKNRTFFGKMYYFGSGAEYDSKHYIPKMKEEYFGKYLPQDAYGFAKYTMSRIAQCSDNIYDLRLFGVYGKYEQWQRRFISNALCRSIKDMPITISQNVRFDYLYITDLCSILERLISIEPKYHCYNVCAGEVIDLKNIAKMINRITGLNSEIQIKNSGYKLEYSADNQRLKDEIGEYRITSIENGIKELYTYYRTRQNDIQKELLI